jgi:uncharacterized protein (TIGR02246 family)
MTDDVSAVVEAVTNAWAANDAPGFVQHYSEDATAILPGFHLRNKTEIRTAMADAFAGPLKGSRRRHEVQTVRHLDDDTAIVISQSSTLFPGEAEPPAERWSLATWVLSRRTGQWLIEAYHDCPAK